ncbi:MAG: DUF2254 domain-containing protein [Chroococcidiopsidaceae cyanobacterium CP_BM_ER_R8_30]|nr:DUF2254 domain-containing protein [Chroococcidiopsidaceae cyanobacterium CP_BM_ER_R8_30]
MADEKLKLRKLWESLHSSFWFVPTLMVAVAVGLSFATIAIDNVVKNKWLDKLGWIYANGPDGARTVLSTIAGSMITVATTAFSITIVALQLASGQFGPRLLRNFMRDTSNQIVLGTFISTYIYCLLVLRTIEGFQNKTFVPQVAVTFGIMMAVASLGVLIYFIHHTAESIQADNLIAKVSQELNKAIDRLFPLDLGQEPPEPKRRIEEIPTNFDLEAYPILATGSGYLQEIDNDYLMQLATQNNLLLRLKSRPGKFVVQGSELVGVWPGNSINKKLTKQFNDAFIWGVQRTERQDVEFPLHQLVEIAVRALSPAVNDPYTAIRCVDRIAAALCHLAEKDIPSPYRYDKDNRLRIIAEPVTFAGMTDTAFNQIRQYGSSSAAVTIRLLEAIAVIAAHTDNKKHCAALLNHASMIWRGSHEGLPEEQDRKDVEERYQEVLKTLKAKMELADGYGSAPSS